MQCNSYILKISRCKHLIVLKDPGEMEFIFYFIFDSSVFSQGFSIIITLSVALYSNKASLSFPHKIKYLFTIFVVQVFCCSKNTLIAQKHITTLVVIIDIFNFFLLI